MNCSGGHGGKVDSPADGAPWSPEEAATGGSGEAWAALVRTGRGERGSRDRAREDERERSGIEGEEIGHALPGGAGGKGYERERCARDRRRWPRVTGGDGWALGRPAQGEGRLRLGRFGPAGLSLSLS